MNRFLRLLPFLLLFSCNESKLERSCSGEGVTDCLPYEYAEIVSASMTPENVPVDGLGEEITIRVELDKCERSPRPHLVTVVMRVGGLDDAGSDARLINLLELRDDGTDGDAEAMDGVIEVTVDNPFFGISDVPTNTTVAIQFRARMPADCSSGTCIGGTCRSPELEIPYRTGGRSM
ncbi:MAG: hypothetical protein JJ863_08490 [Deltaproteobacteria bacterium]|nr:hypothetical protein [Deltaproteobacteria bacterium]